MNKKETLESTINKVGYLIYPIKGRSMLPLLKDGYKVNLKKENSYQTNDVVLFIDNKTHYVLHRIIKIKEGKAYILGDNSSKLDIIPIKKILGRMVGFYNLNNEYTNIEDISYIHYVESLNINPKINIDELLNDSSYFFNRIDEAIISITPLLTNPSHKVDLNKINQLTCEEFDRLVSLMSNKKVLHLLGLIIDELSLPIDELTYKHIKGSLDKAKIRYTRALLLKNEIIELFNKNEITFFFLKGSEINSIYPNPYLRVSNDIDIYVIPSDYQKAKELLISTYNAEIHDNLHDYHLGIKIEKWTLEVELHFGLTRKSKNNNIHELLEDPLVNAESDPNYPYRKHMDKELYYLFTLTHLAKHALGGELWITMLSDIYLLNKNNHYSKELVKEAGLSEFDYVVNNVSKHFFEGNKIYHQDKELVKYMFLDRYNRYIAINKGKYKSNFRFILSRLIVDKGFLASEYPIIKKHGWLTPLFQVVRWFRVFNKKKWIKSKNEIKSYNTISDETYKWAHDSGLSHLIEK